MKCVNILIVILICVFLNPIIFSSDQSFKFGNPNYSKVVLPITFVKNLPVIEVKIQEKKILLVLDTGADSATIKLTPHVLKTIFVKYSEGQVSSSKDVYGKSYNGRFFVIPELQLGNLKLSNFVAGEELRSFMPVDGIIGNRFLKSFYVFVDYQGAKLILYSKKEYPSELKLNTWEKVHFEHNDIGLILSAKINAFDRELKLCLDTGSGSSRNGKKFGLLRSNNLASLSKENGRFVKFDHVLIDGIDFGQTDFLVVDFNEPPVDGFLGDYFFSNYKVFIDFDHEILFINKY